jgi:hypothetical protein
MLKARAALAVGRNLSHSPQRLANRNLNHVFWDSAAVRASGIIAEAARLLPVSLRE